MSLCPRWPDGEIPSPVFLGLGRVIKDTMGLCVKETLHSVHPATGPCEDFGQSPPQEALCVTQIRVVSSWLRTRRWSESSRAGSGSGGWSQHEVFLWTWEIYSPLSIVRGMKTGSAFLRITVSVCKTGVFQ